MNCPGCSARMNTISYEGVTIESCNSCGGEFIGPAQMAHVVRTREMKFPADLAAEMATRHPTFELCPNEKCRGVKCPGCKGETSPVNYGTDTGICVDRCRNCGGIWLDNTELEKVQLLMERWNDEAPRKITAAEPQLRRAKEETNAIARARSTASRFAFVNAIINRVLDAA